MNHQKPHLSLIERKARILAEKIKISNPNPSNSRDVFDRASADIELKRQEERLRADTLKNAGSQDLIALKREAFNWIRGLVPFYLIVTFIFLGSSQKIGLSDTVVITLLTTTTTNIIGLPYLIIKSLFPDK